MINKQNLIYYTSLCCAIWFALTCGGWTYFANLVISYPIGLLSFVLYATGKKTDNNQKRYRIIKFLLMGGIIFSLLVLLGFVIFEI